MTDETANLVLEIPRKIQPDVADIKSHMTDLVFAQLGIREQIHVMEGSFLRLERTIATVLARLDGIEKRLDLVH